LGRLSLPETEKLIMTDKKYYLSEIKEIAELLNLRKNSEDTLFRDINNISPKFAKEIRDKYVNDKGPVNSLRRELAELILEQKQITKLLIDEKTSTIENESGKRSFKSYTPFSIFYPFFHAGLEFDVKEALTSLADSITNMLDLVGKVKIHAVDFWGSRGFGEDQVWSAIYNASHKSHQTAKQLFLRINHQGIWCGLYDRTNQQFIDELHIPNITENTVMDIVKYFERYKNEILNDEYIKANFLSIGVSDAKFYKLSHGTDFFNKDEIQACINADVVVVHEDTKPKARTPISQYKNFKDAKAGDLFYCCWGNNQMLLIGQFIDDDVREYSLDVDPDGWKERSYRIIQEVQMIDSYKGIKKWWTPNNPSTFIEVPESEYEELNKSILRPYFHAELDPDKTTVLPEGKVGIASQKRIKVLDHQVTPKLDVKIIAKEFANIIDNLEENKGQMLGVFGSWGRGKTFFVDQLKMEFKPKGQEQDRFINLTFNAWKYQETEAIWAYLYEVVLKAYLVDNVEDGEKDIKKKRIRWCKTLRLNLKRKGWMKFAGIILGFAASMIITYGISYELKKEIALELVGAVGLLGLIQGYRIYKKYYQSFKDVIMDYSSQHNYKALLGIQAEIQEELVLLLKHWFGSKDTRRILLFVDDLDRCNEDKIIRIIDALRVMLDDNYLVRKLLIIVAVDEFLLDRAIQLKYDNFKDIQKNLVKEYMDKLFIGGIKFPALYEDEQAVILETYALDGEILEQLIESVENDNVPNDSAFSSTDDNFTYPEPDMISSKIVESEFFLLRSELELLQRYSKEISDNVTPRGLRIYIYRYLLSKNLASAYMSSNFRYQLDDNTCTILASAIAKKSADSKFNATDIDEWKGIKNERLKEFLPKLIEMVVPY